MLAELGWMGWLSLGWLSCLSCQCWLDGIGSWQSYYSVKMHGRDQKDKKKTKDLRGISGGPGTGQRFSSDLWFFWSFWYLCSVLLL